MADENDEKAKRLLRKVEAIGKARLEAHEAEDGCCVLDSLIGAIIVGWSEDDDSTTLYLGDERRIEIMDEDPDCGCEDCPGGGGYYIYGPDE